MFWEVILFDNHHKVIYVCHPYGGKMSNFTEQATLIDTLSKKIHKTLVSPIYAFSYRKYSDKGVERKRDMKDCKNLLSRCDAVLMTGDWIKSKGCLEEVEFAMFINKKIYEYTLNHRFRKCDYSELIIRINKFLHK